MSANMISQRLVQSRRAAARNRPPLHLQQDLRSTPSSLSHRNRPTHPAEVSFTPTIPPPNPQLTAPNRHAATTHVSNSEGDAILAKQRLNRPVSPHLSIYKPQITWISSSLNRITGVALSGSFYVFGLAYLVSPLLGWHLDSHSIAAAVAAWPVLLKVFSKFVIAMPFTYHSFNSIRHLIWDTGSQFTNRQVVITGWTAVAVSVVSALALTFY